MSRLFAALVALALAACGPAVPATRAEQCAAGLDSTVLLPRYSLCVAGTSRCQGTMLCHYWYPGEAAICDSDTGEISRSPLPCERCPQSWQCRDYDNPSIGGGDPLRWCFPGPRCGAESDASASDASADGAVVGG